MSMCLTELETAADALSAQEKRLLIAFLAERLRSSAEERDNAQRDQRGHSVMDIPSVSVGKILRPLGSREEWYDEMLEGRV